MDLDPNAIKVSGTAYKPEWCYKEPLRFDSIPGLQLEEDIVEYSRQTQYGRDIPYLIFSIAHYLPSALAEVLESGIGMEEAGFLSLTGASRERFRAAQMRLVDKALKRMLTVNAHLSIPLTYQNQSGKSLMIAELHDQQRLVTTRNSFEDYGRTFVPNREPHAFVHPEQELTKLLRPVALPEAGFHNSALVTVLHATGKLIDYGIHTRGQAAKHLSPELPEATVWDTNLEFISFDGNPIASSENSMFRSEQPPQQFWNSN